MVVKEDADFSAYENEIKDAAESCPAGVIKFS
jgi:ferredoxin